MNEQVVSADSGSSALKLIFGAQRAGDAAVVLPLPTDTHHTEAVEVGGKRYLVGHPALEYQRAAAQRPNRGRDYHGGEDQHVQMCAGLARAGVPDGTYRSLVVSLPYRSCFDPGADYPQRMKRRSRFAWRDARGAHDVVFAEVTVVPQGVGALRLFERDNPSTALQQALLVDIGSNTVDVVVVRRRPDGTWGRVQAACTSWPELCTSDFFDAWVRLLAREPGLADYPWGYYRLMARAQHHNWHLPHLGERIDLRPSFDRVSADFRSRLLAELEQHCGRALWYELDRIILTGGGAALLSLAADTPWTDSRIVTLDAWANAEGQFYHARQNNDAN